MFSLILSHHTFRMSSQAIVSIDFVLNGISCKQISIDSPLPLDMNQASEESRKSNTSFEYSGRHDHGDLPQLKSTGPHALLVAALQEAKRECDKFLTQKINAEYGYDDAESGKMELEAQEEEDVEVKTKKLCTGKETGHV